jgi:hypothetical protein
MHKLNINWLILFLFFTTASGQSNPDKIDVLIVDGFNNHDWKQTSDVIKNILEGSGLFKVSISTSPSEPEDKEWQSWRADFSKYDVVIQNSYNIHNRKIRWPLSNCLN